MTVLAIQFQQVSFTYEGAGQRLIDDLSVSFAQGWTGVVGANGTGKSTILKLATGILGARQGRVIGPASAVYCRQRTEAPPEHLVDLIHDMTGDALRIMGELGVEKDWPDRWATLSHGERKRAQIAVANWRQPQVLAVDEPTNHLDEAARELLRKALENFQGVGLLVSHDRKLLDDLCRQCLFVDPPRAVLRPGNYSQGMQQARQEALTIQRQRLQAKRDLSRLRLEAAHRRKAASQSNRKRSKKGLAAKDHDARAKIDAARMTGKDGSAGKRLRQLGGRLSMAQKKLDRIKVKKTVRLGIWLPGARSKRNTLFNFPAGSLAIGGQHRLCFPDLSMRPEDRVALTGPNGSGKSTLIRRIVRSLNLPSAQVTFVPQEIDIQASQAVMARARKLPHEQLGKMMTAVSCLGSSPDRILDSQAPSPGEIRKVLIATGIAQVPHLIIMDEPTNHLDLPSIECLERALSDCPCGLLLVSHDQRFLNRLTRHSWHIEPEGKATDRFVLRKA